MSEKSKTNEEMNLAKAQAEGSKKIFGSALYPGAPLRYPPLFEETTLRDRFAGAALTGLIICGFAGDDSMLAKRCFEISDKMVLASQGNETPKYSDIVEKKE